MARGRRYAAAAAAKTQAPAPAAPATEATGDWTDNLVTGKGGAPRACSANAITILTNDPEWADVLAWDAFAYAVVTLRPPPWDTDDAAPDTKPGEWADSDTTRLQAWLARRHDLYLGGDVVYAAVRVVAERRVVHPVRDWLDALQWDGKPRLDTWLHTYLGVQRKRYASVVGRCFLIGGVARAYKPGCKLDTMLVLEGPQGALKSSAARVLFGERWFSDTPLDLNSKDRFVSVRGVWGLELAELDSLRRVDVARIKSFLSSPTDSYRPPYGRGLVSVPRSCILLGTCNRDDYLVDETGNRRFLPVACGKIDLDAIKRDREQLWAEARDAFHDGEAWWPEGTDVAACASEQSARLQSDAWLDSVADHVDGLPMVTVAQVLRDALGLPKDRWGQPEQNRVARCLRTLGWTRHQRYVAGAKTWVYLPPTPPATNGASASTPSVVTSATPGVVT